MGAEDTPVCFGRAQLVQRLESPSERDSHQELPLAVLPLGLARPRQDSAHQKAVLVGILLALPLTEKRLQEEPLPGPMEHHWVMAPLTVGPYHEAIPPSYTAIR